MDEFFQKLREIQKKERNLSGLAPVGENFYQNISRYFNVLMKKIDNNPFSFESYLLRDAQRITAEICERREHKISNSAVMGVQRSHQLFKESDADSPTPPKIPRNSTPEEEKLFHALVESLIIYREDMGGPLRFQSLQTDDRSSNIPDEAMEDIPGGNDLKEVAEAGAGSDASHEDVDKGTELDKHSVDENKGFTAEEEAAIENDIYKQFGKEPFPGDNLKKGSGNPRKGSGNPPEEGEHSKDGKPLNSKSDEPDSSGGISENQQINQPDNHNVKTDVLLVLEELPSIMGVDRKVYGPLLPQDIVTLPEPNARILIKNQKGKSIQNYK